MPENIFLVPVQADLDWNESVGALRVICIHCEQAVIMDELDEHEQICSHAWKARIL